MKKGDRLELVHINDKFTNLNPGDKGTIDYIDDLKNIHMKWDNGSTLSLIPGVDEYFLIKNTEINELYDTDELKSQHEIEHISGFKVPELNRFKGENIDMLDQKLTRSFLYLNNHFVESNWDDQVILYFDQNTQWYISFSIQITSRDLYDICICYKWHDVEYDEKKVVSTLKFSGYDVTHVFTRQDISYRELEVIMRERYLPLLKKLGFSYATEHSEDEN